MSRTAHARFVTLMTSSVIVLLHCNVAAEADVHRIARVHDLQVYTLMAIVRSSMKLRVSAARSSAHLQI